MMKTLALLFLAILPFAQNAAAQDSPAATYDFMLAKLAADEGRYDEALSHVERVLQIEPSNPSCFLSAR